jgi:hypothetical protein
MTESLMFLRRFLLVAGSALAVVLGGLSSCQTEEDPSRSRRFMRGADVDIRGAGAMEIRQAVVDVMTENDFRLASPFGNSMSFEKAGTRNDEWMYGSYGSRPMRQRVTVTLEIGDDPEIIRLVATGVVVREYSNMSGEEIGGLFAGGAMRYSRYLDQVKDRVESSIRQRPGM